MTVFAAVLDRLLRTDSGRPLVTFYDEATGERVELSVATYANWVAKVSSLLLDELDLARGDTLRVDLPVHWLTPVLLGAAWNGGLVVSDTDTPDAVVTGPDGLARWDGYGGGPVVATALAPLGVRFREPLPAGVLDLGVEVWSQPDSFRPWDPPSDEDPAVALAGLRLTQAQLWEATAGVLPQTHGGRLLSVANPASPPGLASFTEPLATGGSVVLVSHADPGRLETIAAVERVTDRFGTARFEGPD
ncbi:TIGR03089 family protein [Nocardioides sp.]|uniref:TIGR03089 family protein n=1 Tax=Nocardioides sp. TaxID=35761 RepID=UPI0039E65A73